MESAVLRTEAAAANQGLRADQAVRRQMQNRAQLLNGAGAAAGESANSVAATVLNVADPKRKQ